MRRLVEKFPDGYEGWEKAQKKSYEIPEKTLTSLDVAVQELHVTDGRESTVV
jgi:hypothetical protein